jgi:hypothetical protein
MIYRICTEAKNATAVEKLVGRYFEGYSVMYQDGFWHGAKERSMTIEIFSSQLNSGDLVRLIAEQIRDLNKQECVLVQEIECIGRFI